MSWIRGLFFTTILFYLHKICTRGLGIQLQTLTSSLELSNDFDGWLSISESVSYRSRGDRGLKLHYTYIIGNRSGSLGFVVVFYRYLRFPSLEPAFVRVFRFQRMRHTDDIAIASLHLSNPKDSLKEERNGALMCHQPEVI